MRLSEGQRAGLAAVLRKSRRRRWRPGEVEELVGLVATWLEGEEKGRERAVISVRSGRPCPHGFLLGVCGYCLGAAGKIPEVRLPDRSRFEPRGQG